MDTRVLLMPRKAKTLKKILELPTDYAEWLQSESLRLNKSEEQVLMDNMAEGFLVLEVNKEIQEASEAIAKWVNPTDWGFTSLEQSKSGQPETEKNLAAFRKLRREFAPVSSAVDHTLNFIFGNDSEVRIDDKTDDHQIKAKETIESLNKNIYQDAIIAGAKRLFRMIKDIEITEGVSAAQIVYDKPVNFYDFAKGKTIVNAEGKEQQIWVPKEMKGEDYKKLGGVVQLKIIDNAQSRLVPIRDTATYQILHFILDANKGSKDKNKKQEPIRLHTWQVLWLSSGASGTSLYGPSEVKKIYSAASLLESIMKALGINFKKWSKKRYFFILGTEKRRWSSPEIRNFIKNVQEMVKKNGTGIPLPAGFDIKEIGGEVFEGRAILDHFVDLIGAGMKVPKSLILQRREDENEQAWIGFMATTTNNQKMFADDIERQLWQRHLWCTFGSLDRRIKKQGVPEEKQERAPIFVPHLTFKTMGKWQAKDLMNLLAGVLNVANPVGGELKLVVEKLMAGTLEIFDADFKVAEKLLSLNQEIEVMNAEIEKELTKKAKEKEIWNDEEVFDAWIAKNYGKIQKPEEEQEPEDKQEKRLEKGVSVEKHETGKETEKGKAKNLGGTRKPKESKGGAKEKGMGKKVEESIDYKTLLDREKLKALMAIKDAAKRI